MKQCKECGAFSTDDTLCCPVCGTKFTDDAAAGSSDSDSPTPKIGDNNCTSENASQSNSITASLLQHIVLLLNNKEFDTADSDCNLVLNIDPTNAEAYIDKLLIKFKCSTLTELEKSILSIADSSNYRKAMQFGNESQRMVLKETEEKIQNRIGYLKKENEPEAEKPKYRPDEELSVPKRWFEQPFNIKGNRIWLIIGIILAGAVIAAAIGVIAEPGGIFLKILCLPLVAAAAGAPIHLIMYAYKGSWSEGVPHWFIIGIIAMVILFVPLF